MDWKNQSKVRKKVVDQNFIQLLPLSKIDLSIHQFSIGDISALGGEYRRGGIAREVKQSMTMTFVSQEFHFSIGLLSIVDVQAGFNEQIHNPRILTTDGSDYWTKEITGEVSGRISV